MEIVQLLYSFDGVQKLGGTPVEKHCSRPQCTLWYCYWFKLCWYLKLSKYIGDRSIFPPILRPASEKPVFSRIKVPHKKQQVSLMRVSLSFMLTLTLKYILVQFSYLQYSLSGRWTWPDIETLVYVIRYSDVRRDQGPIL